MLARGERLERAGRAEPSTTRPFSMNGLECVPEAGGVGGVDVDLVGPAVHREGDRLIGVTPVEVIGQLHNYGLGHGVIVAERRNPDNVFPAPTLLRALNGAPLGPISGFFARDVIQEVKPVGRTEVGSCAAPTCPGSTLIPPPSNPWRAGVLLASDPGQRRWPDAGSPDATMRHGTIATIRGHSTEPTAGRAHARSRVALEGRRCAQDGVSQPGGGPLGR